MITMKLFLRPPTPPEEEPDPFVLIPPGGPGAGDEPFQLSFKPPGGPGAGDEPF